MYPDTETGQIDSFTVAFTSLSAKSSSGEDQLTPSGYAAAAILDSGTTITLLPNDIVDLVYEELGATVSEELDAVVVPCSLADHDGTINYGFGGTGGPVIEVAVSQLVLPLYLENGEIPQYTNGEDACQLGIEAAGDLPVLFGDTFLRSAYVVYDLINNRIALAQTDFNSTGSNIVPFASSGAEIPSATLAPSQAAVTQTGTGIPRGGEVTATGSASGEATYNPTQATLSAAAGFTSTSTSTSAAAVGPAPFEWIRVVVGGVCLALMGVGGGVFVWL